MEKITKITCCFALFGGCFSLLMANAAGLEPEEVYVAAADTFAITINSGASGLDDGDVVTWNGANQAVANLTFGVDAFLSIQAGVDAVCAGGNVFIAAGTYDEGSEILINKALTINGDGADVTVLSGGSNGDLIRQDGEHRVMLIDTGSGMNRSAEITLIGIALVDGIAAVEDSSSLLNSGGGILVENGVLAVRACAFLRNVANDNGGGLYSNSSLSDGVLKISNSEFAENISGSGGGLYVRSEAFEISDSVFRANRAISMGDTLGISGGAIETRGETSSVVNSVFIGNTAEDDGGAIYQFGRSIALTDVLFEENEAADGGAVYSRDEMELERVRFVRNTAFGSGGGMVNFSGTITANDVSFLKNKAIVDGNIFGESGEGGGMTNQAPFTGTNISFIGNVATDANGGGLWNRDDFTVTNLLVRDNVSTFQDPAMPGFSASADGGGIFNIFGSLNVTNGLISNNSSVEDGGGVYSQFGSVELTDVTIVGNSAKKQGGGVYGNADSVTLIQCTISSNEAEEVGGGVFDGSDAFRAVHCTITGNSSSDEGGGFYRSGTEASATIANSMIAGNDAGNSGDDIRADFTPAGVNFIGIPNPSFPGFRDGVDLSFASTSAVSVNDLVTPLSDNGGNILTHAVVENSPLINAGGNSAVPVELMEDQRGNGFVRIFNTTVDIGALEFGDRGADLAINIAQILPNKNVVLEAAVIPGQRYALEYSDDLTPFTRIPGSIVATTNRLRVTDIGPPLTATPPGQESRRFYRVVQLP